MNELYGILILIGLIQLGTCAALVVLYRRDKPAIQNQPLIAKPKKAFVKKDFKKRKPMVQDDEKGLIIEHEEKFRKNIKEALRYE